MMQLKAPGLRALLVAIVAFGLLHACSVSTILQGRPGTDTKTIGKGSPREHVDELLGPPTKQWTSILGVKYCLYQFDDGVPPNLGAALFFLAVGIATAGVTEAIAHDLSPDELIGSETARWIISYDAEDKVLGVFNWADDLPPDGIPRVKPRHDPEISPG